MRSKRSLESGFSLLELIIVLVVMVSLLAIAWPSLQRPLQRTSLNEAAQTLRSAIDDCRYQAISTGSPIFVQLRQGQEVVRAGSFESFLADLDGLQTSTPSTLQPANLQPASLQSTRSQPTGRQTNSAAAGLSQIAQPEIRTWTLPATVVISEVRWTLEAPAEELGDDSLDSVSAVAEVQSDAMVGGGLGNGINDALGQDAGRTWWLPLVASGQGRDAAIVLLDTALNEELTVTFASATGALEIVK